MIQLFKQAKSKTDFVEFIGGFVPTTLEEAAAFLTPKSIFRANSDGMKKATQACYELFHREKPGETVEISGIKFVPSFSKEEVITYPKDKHVKILQKQIEDLEKKIENKLAKCREKVQPLEAELAGKKASLKTYAKVEVVISDKPKSYSVK